MGFLFSRYLDKAWFAPLIFLLILVAFFWPVFIKGYVLSPAGSVALHMSPWTSFKDELVRSGTYRPVGSSPDEVMENYSWQRFLVNVVREGHLPLWNPHNGLGYPLFANNQSAFFFPLSWIAFLLPVGAAITVDDILKLFLS